MTGSSSPCGACKFLRRKCLKGCVFAPYFCHEQGASQFAAIHKVFGASNVSKLLAHLPVSDRSEAALTISYEAQARVHDPVYGCISHIFALQQQVVNLQAQLAYLKQQGGQGQFNGTNSSTNPNWCHQLPGNNPILHHQNQQTQVFNQTNLTHLMNMASMESSENSISSRQNQVVDPYSCSYDETNSQTLDEIDERKWGFEDADDLRSVAFRGGGLCPK
uniref:LOB domain-containing protein n=1 Tax=Kalanchoe fedtschenkoi TaxID=63787 RepID=A0A7N0VIA9_KALFE